MWISVKDRLPEDGGKQIPHVECFVVIIYKDGSRETTTGYYAFRFGKITGSWTVWNTPPDYTVTHWMPIPEVPGD